MTAYSIFADRAQLQAQWRSGDNQYDLIVVGGGITGAGVLREAARCGYRALLIEQTDFAWGTSSRSSKMIHGGLRYLAAGDMKLTRESLSERERLLREAPGLIERIGYTYLLRKGSFPGRFSFGLILKLYDLFARVKNHRFFSRAQVMQRIPGLNSDRLKGAGYYTDAITDDARLVLRVLQEASSSTTAALNYLRAGDLREGDDGIIGLQVEDCLSGEQFELRAPVVVNATGVWADRLRNQLNSEKRVRPLRGSHLVFAADKLPVSEVVVIPHPADKRGVYIYPWEGVTLVGTTDLDHGEHLDAEACISEYEITYLMQVVESLFPQAPVTRADIVSTFSGVRPVIAADDARDPSKERRDHAVWFDRGLVTVSGGKLTTFRLIAKDALAAVSERLPQSTAGGESEQIFAALDEPLPQLADAEQASRLRARFGNLAAELLGQAREGEEAVLPGTHYSLAELRWSARCEAVAHLDDLLLRRSRIGLLLPRGAEQLLAQVAPICHQELGWDESRWLQERDRYLALVRQYYSLPEDAEQGH